MSIGKYLYKVKHARVTPLHKTIHHALFAGLVEGDGECAVDYDDVAVAERLMEDAVADGKLRDDDRWENYTRAPSAGTSRVSAPDGRQPMLAKRRPPQIKKIAIYFRPDSAGWAMTSTLNYAIGAVALLGLFAVALAVMVW